MQLGVREVAELLNVSEKTVYRWLKQGKLPAYKINDQYRIHRAELL
jgi:nitrogen PTS system EIIA component